MPFNRALAATCCLGICCLGGAGPANAQETDAASPAPSSGVAVPGMSSFDRVLPAFLQKWEMPGASIAVMKDDRLVLARGYGWADVEAHEPVTTTSRFRIASITKPITSAAILLLVQRGRLYLDAPVFTILSDLQPLPGKTPDPRLKLITVRQLLQHCGGWDRDTWGDPLWNAARKANADGIASSTDNGPLISSMMSEPLQFTPGTRAAYSNFGYILLGRIIEKVTGESYETWVKANVLSPVGADAMQEGRSKAAGRAQGEVHYYDYPGAPLTATVTGHKTDISRPYSCGLEAMSAAAGWIGSPSDYLRFVAGVDGLPARTDILTPASEKEMAERPSYKVGAPTYYGLGWMIRPTLEGNSWWHKGTLPGTSTLVARLPNGVTWVVMLNSHPEDDEAFGPALEAAMRESVEGVTAWPEGDSFEDAGAVGQNFRS